MSNAVMYSLYKPWCDKIFSGEKSIEFRTKLPKELGVGTKIYLYETKKHNGTGCVVGECTVKDIIPVLSKRGKWPTYGCYPFIEYYCENIVGDFETADHIRKIKEEFEDKFTNYKHGYILHYMFCEDNLNEIRKSGQPIDTWKIFDYDYVRKILDELEMADKIIESCDDWLMDIGYYNDMLESYYKWGLVLSNVVQYDEPIPLSMMLDKNREKIVRPPQSYCYVSGVEKKGEI